MIFEPTKFLTGINQQKMETIESEYSRKQKIVINQFHDDQQLMQKMVGKWRQSNL